MPKKFKGENSKAVEARARKQEKAEAEKSKKEKAIEDEYWKDDNKAAAKKQVSDDNAIFRSVKELRSDLLDLEVFMLPSFNGRKRV